MRTLRIVALSGVLAALLCLSTFGQQDVFTDDFNDGDALGWAAVSGGRGWHVQDGRYVFDGSGWGRYRAVANVYLVDGAISFKATPWTPPTTSSFGSARTAASASCSGRGRSGRLTASAA